MANYNLSLPAETIDELLLWLDDKQGIIIKQTDLLSGTGQSTTATMTQKAITDAIGAEATARADADEVLATAIGTKADASSVYTKTQADALLNLKADKSTTYTKTETDTRLNNKVDKEPGKGLSSNDYTDAEKAKLGALPTAAELSTDLAAKQDKDTDAVAGNVAVMNASGNSEDGGVHLSDLATKAEVAVVAGEAGLAEAVIDTDNAGTEQEFTFRKSGGDGGAYYRKIKGKTLAWNQLVQNGNFADTSIWTTYNSAVLSVSANVGTLTINSQYGVIQQAAPLVAGHAYLFVATYKTATNYFLLGIGQYNSVGSRKTLTATADGAWHTNAIVWSGTDTAILTGDKNIFVGNRDKNSGSIDVKNIMLIDLTQMFGAGNEPSSVAEFEALYPDAYYPYNPGDLISNDADAVETTGVNLLDTRSNEGSEQYIGHYYINSDGTMASNGGYNAFRIKVFPGIDYYLTNSSGIVLSTNAILRLEDSNENLIGVNTALYNSTGGIVTTPTSCAYIVLSLPVNRNDEIQFNLSNAAINGQYFPYWERTLQLDITTKEDTDGNVPFADGMKGAGTAADWADKVGGEKRMGRVKFSDLTFERASTNVEGKYRFRAAIPTAKNSGEGIGSKYAKVASTAAANETGFTIASSNHNLYIYDEAYSTATAEAFAAAVANEYLDFELDTPVPFTWAEPLNLGVKVDENGTERAVAPEGATAPSAPFVADTTYTMSVARMVEILKNL